MEDVISELDRQVMSAFGRVHTLTRSDGQTSQITGVLSRDVQPAGVFEAVQSQTLFTGERELALKRGDQIATTIENWRVDRKLKDDGHLAQWSLHAY